MNEKIVDREYLKQLLAKLNYDQLEEILYEQIKQNLNLKEIIAQMKGSE